MAVSESRLLAALAGPNDLIGRATVRAFEVRLAMAVLVVILSSTLPSPAWSQNVTGSLAGRVVDVDDEPLDGVAVTLTDPGRSVSFDALTDARGNFRFLALPVATYELRFERIGYREVVHASVQTRLGVTVSVGEVVLEVEAVPLEPIEVTTEGVLAIDPTSTIVGSNIEAETFEQLPTGRDYKTILQLLPQANESFFTDPVNVAGSTGLANMYFIDGANVTDGFRGRTGTDLPFNFVKAIELKQGGYQAEFGQALGGHVNVVTHSGTNRFMVDGFGYFSGHNLSAEPTPVPGTVANPAFSDYDVGVRVSGPVVRDRLWYVAAYNPSFLRADVELEGFGTRTGSVTRHMFAGKLDWQPGSRTHLSLSVFGDPTKIDEVNPAASGFSYATIDPALLTRDEGSTNVSLNASTWAGARWLFEGTVGYHDRSESMVPTTEIGRTEPSFWDRSNADEGIVVSGGAVDHLLDFNSSRAFLKATTTFFAGSHAIKFGGEYQDNRMNWLIESTVAQKFSDTVWALGAQTANSVVHNRVATLFLQDSWAVSRRFQLNFGLRWDGQWLDGGSGGTFQPIPDQWQPRVGLVFQPGRLGTQKIFGYFGRFYQQLALLLPALEFSLGNDARFMTYDADPRANPGLEPTSTTVFLDPDVPAVGPVPGLRGEHLDEFAVGYERLFGPTFKLVVRGVHRVLRDNIEVAFNLNPPPVGTFGNRGSGNMEIYENPQRNYSAAELSLHHQSRSASVLASYVLSRHYGNYQGLLGTETGRLEGGSFGPNNNQTLYIPAQVVNNRGLLPNDRTHVLKLSGAYRFDFGLTSGAFFQLSSGTPLNDFQWGTSPFGTPIFLVPRGTAGRTPAIWDLNFRFTYDIPTSFMGRLVLDLLHIGNPQGVVDRDQARYNTTLCEAGPCQGLESYDEFVANPGPPNAVFGQAIGFQPPFTVRLGVQIGT